ncbi:hypothetical protein [Leptospira kanakyensis]|uniref:hypothetical protein n=1 Tax=Leptospira kanakyensis TaxID=2484968 RepID=UPI00223CD792|nr:hypothetical protein [Leptospira kanakyensis]MCW7471800.1 hypothetical protein [Leptospira kanakyensis]MCW7483242.1 hypothetical protein [Leptospira kanakyensis]
MKFQEPYWKCIIQDAHKLSLGQGGTFNFFNEESGADTTLLLSEDDIVNLIHKDENFLNLLLEVSGIQYYSKALKHISKHKVLGSGSGDFDLVVYGPNYPFELISFEFKRIKVEALNYEKDKINKIKGIEKLFNQLEERVRMGFLAVYGVIIIHSDLRERKTANTILRSYTIETNERIFYQINSSNSFPTEAGLILLKFEQPTGKKYAINFKVGLVKLAEKLKENEEIKERFLNYLSNFH